MSDLQVVSKNENAKTGGFRFSEAEGRLFAS